jgi:hypothetical protein
VNAVALLATVVFGASAPVVLVTRPETTAITNRIAAELRTLDFEPITEAPGRELDREALEELAQAKGAVAIIMTRWSRRGVEIFVTDRVTGKTVVREEVGGTGTRLSDVEVAVRAVELLRASLLEVAVNPAAVREPLPAQMAQLVPAPSRPPPGRLALRVLITGAWSPGGTSASGTLSAEAGYLVRDWLVVRGRLASWLLPATFRNDLGSVAVSPLALGLGGSLIGGARLRWSLGLELNAALVRVEGTGVAPWVGRSATVPAFGATAEGTLGWQVTPGWAVGGVAQVGLLLPSVAVRFDGATVAAWGGLVASLGLFVEVRP